MSKPLASEEAEITGAAVSMPIAIPARELRRRPATARPKRCLFQIEQKLHPVPRPRRRAQSRTSVDLGGGTPRGTGMFCRTKKRISAARSAGVGDRRTRRSESQVEVRCGYRARLKVGRESRQGSSAPAGTPTA
jgi:hypothetical protein